MRRSRPIRLAAVAVAAVTIGACGSTATHVSSSAPRKLSLLESSGGAASRPALYPQRATTYVLDGALADLGLDAPVRKLIGHQVTAADLARITDALGMHATPVRTETGWQLHDGDALLTVGTSGAATFVDYTSTGGSGAGSSPGSVGSGSVGIDGSAISGSGNPSAGVAEPPAIPPIVDPPTAPPQTLPAETVPPTTLPAPVDVPSAGDAVNIAQSLLNGLGVLSDQQWADDVTDAGGIAVSCPADVECDATPAIVSARTVTYELVVDGVRVPGVSWSVTIGEHQRVESVSGTWARPEGAGSYALRSTQNVFDDLRNGHAAYVGPQPLTATAAPEIAPDTATVDTSPLPTIEVRITGVSLGVARWDGTENTHAVAYLVPTYRFHARVTDGSPYDIELLALDPANFALVAPPTTGGPKPGQPSGSVVPQPAPTPEPSPAPVPTPDSHR